jgi:hypothetical protein
MDIQKGCWEELAGREQGVGNGPYFIQWIVKTEKDNVSFALDEHWKSMKVVTQQTSLASCAWVVCANQWLTGDTLLKYRDD